MCGKNLSIYGVHIPRKSLNLCFFTHAPVPYSKLLVEFFENLFPQHRRSGLICSSIKIESEYMKMTWNISFFPFGRITIFLNVMALQFCNVYQTVWY